MDQTKTRRNNISKRQRIACFQANLGSFLAEAKKYKQDRLIIKPENEQKAW